MPVESAEFHRLPFNVYFGVMAVLASQRATCPRRQVGCVLVKDSRIISTGYNGSPPGLPHCTEIGCRMEDGHCTRTIHAEENALIQMAALGGPPVAGAVAFITDQPCLRCAERLYAAGVREFNYIRAYGKMPIDSYDLVGVEFRPIEIDERRLFTLLEIFKSLV